MVGGNRRFLTTAGAAAVMLLLFAAAASAQIPVQIINSSPDPALAFVDVYVDGVQVADNLAFKAATPFVDEFSVPQIIITPTSTIDVVDQGAIDNSSPLASTTVLLTMGQATLIEILGYLIPGNFDPNPDARSTALEVKAWEGYKPLATNPATAELMAVHAAPNLGTVDLVARAVHDVPGVGFVLYSGLAYGDILPYLVLLPSVAALDLVETGTSNLIETWVATLGLIQGAGAVGHVGGILTQPDNQGLTLYGAVATGFVFVLANASRTDAPQMLPADAVLGHNFPNPYNPRTVIPFTLYAGQHVSLKVYNLQGREVDVLIDRVLEAGDYEIPYEPTGLASGAYLYELRTADSVSSKMMTLVK
jgi:hypothetical protein